MRVLKSSCNTQAEVEEFNLQPSFDTQSEIFIDDKQLVSQALANIHESLTIALFFDIILASNSKVQHLSAYSPKNAINAVWQYNITTFLREKLASLHWTLIDGKGGVAYILSPYKKHAIRVLSGNRHVGMKDGLASNNCLKGTTLSDDIYAPSMSFENNTQIWTLLFYKEPQKEVMRLELSRPNSFEKGKIVDWHTRIKIPHINFHLPDKPLKNIEKAEVGTVPVRRKKAS